MSNRRSESDRRVRQCQRFGRYLRLLCLIQEKHSRWNLDTLSRELDCSRKTVQRDLLIIEDAGIPYRWDEREGCYRIRPDFRLAMLDRPSTHAPATGPGPTQPGPPGAPTLVDLAESSRESADRLVSEAG